MTSVKHIRVLSILKHDQWVMPTYMSFFLIWLIPWQLTVLQGDDRFFVTASGLPWGFQTPYYILDMTARTWLLYNGRIADGLGTLWYIFGDSFARVIFAGSYVLLAFLLEKIIQMFVTIPPEKKMIARVLLACVPFILIATNTAIAGESVLLAAAAWNYIIPLDLIFLVFSPLLSHLSGRAVASRSFAISLVGIFIALQMHEMLTIAVFGMMVGFALYSPQLLRDHHYRFASVVVLVGLVAKILSPGLWQRTDKKGVGGYTEGLSTLEIRVIKGASVFSDFPVFYALLGVLLLVLIVVYAWRLNSKTWMLSTKTGLALTTVGILALGLWVCLSWYHRLMVTALMATPDRIPSQVSSKLLALLVFCALVALLVGLLWVNEVSVFLKTPLPVVFFAGVGITILTSALMAHHLYEPLHRAHYVSLIFLSLTCMILVIHLVAPTQGVAQSSLVHVVVTFIVCLSLTAWAAASSQVFQNRLAWANVENEIQQAKSGLLNVVHYPDALPCRDLTWYFWPDDIERNYQQLAIYYDIPAGIKFETVPQNRECLPANY